MEIHKANLEAQTTTTTQKAAASANSIPPSHPIQPPWPQPHIIPMQQQNILAQSSTTTALLTRPEVPISTTAPSCSSSQAAQTFQTQLCAAAGTLPSAATALPNTAGLSNNGNCNTTVVNPLAQNLPMTYFLARPNTTLPTSFSQPTTILQGAAANIGQHSTLITNPPPPQQQLPVSIAQQLSIPAAAAALSAAAAQRTPSSSSYHVTPKLKSPAGMQLTSITSRGIDKFAPY